MDESEVALICKAFRDMNRIRIIKSLSKGSKCANEILSELDITQPTLSHHMKILSGCGIAVTKRDGKNTVYTLCCRRLGQFKAYIAALECVKNPLSDCPENTPDNGQKN